MTSPVQYHYQETEIESIYNVISKAYANLVQIIINSDSKVEDSEINDFKTSIKNIGDRTSLHALLRDVKATQPLSHKTIETNPNKAVAWLLQYKDTLDSILEMGDTNASLGEQCFNKPVTYQICERLPHTLQQQMHQIKEDGRQKLKKIIDIDSKARTLQETSRTQQYTTGKPSTPAKNSDTAQFTIRPAPPLPREHHSTADREDHGQEGPIKKARPTHTNKSNLPVFKSRLRGIIHTLETLLAKMTTPVQSLAQEFERDGHTKRINDMILGANTDLLYAEARYKTDSDVAIIKELKTSIANIEHRTYTVLTDLRAWKASNASTPLSQDEEDCDDLEQKVTRYVNHPNAEYHSQPDSNPVEVEGNADGTPLTSQPEVLTLDANTSTTKHLH